MKATKQTVNLTVCVEGGVPIPASIEVRVGLFPALRPNSTAEGEPAVQLLTSGIIQCPELDMEIERYLNRPEN